MKQIKTKYNGVLGWDDYQEYLINQIFKVLPLMEEEKDWRRFLEGLLVELMGLSDLALNISFTSLVGRLNGLLVLSEDQINSDLFKKIVFDSIQLLKSIEPGE